MEIEEICRKIDLLTKLEEEYKKQNNNKENIYPREWYYLETTDFDTKIDLLSEAIEKKVLLRDLSYIHNIRHIMIENKLNENIQEIVSRTNH